MSTTDVKSNPIAQFKKARKYAVPIIAYETPDNIQSIKKLAENLNGEHPIFCWDVAKGVYPLNKPASEYIKAGNIKDPQEYTNPAMLLISLAPELPEDSMLFMKNPHRFFENHGVIQGISNLRDEYKATGRTLALFSPSFAFPPEIINDVYVIEEGMPDEAEIKQVALKIAESAEISSIGEAALDKIANAARGLTSFQVDQTIALSTVFRQGINVDQVWERAQQEIGKYDGLSIWRGGQTFADIAGYGVTKHFFTRVINGRRPISCVVFIDEIEKKVSYGSSDVEGSGVDKDQIGTQLSWMEDHKARGALFTGFPGCSKTLMAKAIGAEAGVPIIQFDPGAMKGKYVGESEFKYRNALKVIERIGGENTLWIATSNRLDSIPPELIRRFNLCNPIFFDLPEEEERSAIWEMYLRRYELSGPIPDSRGWTGAQIATCCDLAWQLNDTLIEAAKTIIPYAIANKKQLEDLRTASSGKYLSASYEGFYQKPDAEELSSKPKSARKFNMGE